MTRTLTAAVETEFSANALRPAVLVKAEFASGDVRVWSGIQDTTFGAETYLGAGNLLGISTALETQNLQANGLQFTFSGIPSSYVALALDPTEYRWGAITAWIAVTDENFELIADPYKFFAGNMDVAEISDNGDASTITMNAENNLIGLRDAKETRYTHEDQVSRFTGDLGLEYMPTNADQEITWGA